MYADIFMPAVIFLCERSEVLLHHLGLVHEAAVVLIADQLPPKNPSFSRRDKSEQSLSSHQHFPHKNYTELLAEINDIDTLTLQYALRCLTQPTTTYTGYQVAIYDQ
jgi:hypothetical protein